MMPTRVGGIATAPSGKGPGEQPCNSVRASRHLALGTAQLGMHYGIANHVGIPHRTTAVEIVAAAYQKGVRLFDTAQDYGESETVLGHAFAELALGDQVHVVSKLGGAVDTTDRAQIMESIRASLSRLRLPQLFALFLHREEQLTHWEETLGATLRETKAAGLTRYLGVSVYSVESALRALEMEDIDAIQVPCNVFDRRMKRSGVFDRARVLRKAVFVRSVYLQGLALLEPQRVPERIFRGAEAAKALQQFCEKYGLDRLQFAVDHVRWMAPESRLVIGVESVDQLVGNCEVIEAEASAAELHRAWDEVWPGDHEKLIDPRVW